MDMPRPDQPENPPGFDDLPRWMQIEIEEREADRAVHDAEDRSRNRRVALESGALGALLALLTAGDLAARGYLGPILFVTIGAALAFLAARRESDPLQATLRIGGGLIASALLFQTFGLFAFGTLASSRPYAFLFVWILDLVGAYLIGRRIEQVRLRQVPY